MAFISNGTTILDNGAFDVSLGNLVLISEQTASASASIEFTTGIDSTYPIYKFEFINIHPSSDAVYFQFNMSTDGGSNYNVTKTTTFFISEHSESDASGLYYWTPGDLAQSTSYQYLNYQTGNGSDESLSGYLQIFNPSSTTFVKHFIARTQHYAYNDYSQDVYAAGYGNTTSAVNAIRFQFSSGNIDSGTIKLYGIKDS
jgi:hypothetical protein